jgi:hypothetical protein
MTTSRRSRCRDDRPAVVFGLGFVTAWGCVTSSVEPAITFIDPPQSYTDATVRLTIHTTGVRGRLDINLGAATDTRGNGSLFQLLPDEAPTKPIPLSAVVWSSEDVFMADARQGLDPGAYTVKVINPDGRSATSKPDAFHSLGHDDQPPKLTLISPQDGSAMLAGGMHEAIIEVDDQFGQITPPVWTTSNPDAQVVTPQSCVPDGTAEEGEPQRWKATFPVPAPARGQPLASFHFRVSVTDGGANSATLDADFKAIEPPTIDEVSPVEGALNGGTSFIIRGSNFVPGARVLFGGAVALATSVLASDIIAGTTPAHGRAESVPIAVVTLANQQAQVASGFRYLAPPRLRGIEPASGPTQGEISITAKGTDFRMDTKVYVGTGPDDRRLLLGGAIVLPPNKVTGCLNPGAKAGPMRVWAEDPITGGSDADAVEFTYVENASAVASPASSLAPSPSPSPSLSATSAPP